MNKTQQNQKARNEKAAAILRTVEKNELATVAGGGCLKCGKIISLDNVAVK